MKQIINTLSRSLELPPVITIRNGVIAFNHAFFMRGSELGAVIVRACDAQRKLDFQFIDAKLPLLGKFKISNDGSKSMNGKGRVLLSRKIFSNHKWLYDIASKPLEQRQFIADLVEERWTISLASRIEKRLLPGERPEAGTVIYFYYRENELIYVGRGRLTERMRDPIRQTWNFTHIVYSVINNPVVEECLEREAIDDYFKQFGRRPEFNRISGKSARDNLAPDRAISVLPYILTAKALEDRNNSGIRGPSS